MRIAGLSINLMGLIGLIVGAVATFHTSVLWSAVAEQSDDTAFGLGRSAGVYPLHRQKKRRGASLPARTPYFVALHSCSQFNVYRFLPIFTDFENFTDSLWTQHTATDF
jgi:hypothetical protein